MGNSNSMVSSQSIGDFQAEVGRAESDFNLIGAYIFGGFLIFIAMVMIIYALIEAFYSMLIIAGLFVVAGIAVIFISRFNNKLVHSNKSYAQFCGTMDEIELARDIMGGGGDRGFMNINPFF